MTPLDVLTSYSGSMRLVSWLIERLLLALNTTRLRLVADDLEFELSIDMDKALPAPYLIIKTRQDNPLVHELDAILRDFSADRTEDKRGFTYTNEYGAVVAQLLWDDHLIREVTNAIVLRQADEFGVDGTRVP